MFTPTASYFHLSNNRLQMFPSWGDSQITLSGVFPESTVVLCPFSVTFSLSVSLLEVDGCEIDQETSIMASFPGFTPLFTSPACSERLFHPVCFYSERVLCCINPASSWEQRRLIKCFHIYVWVKYFVASMLCLETLFQR